MKKVWLFLLSVLLLTFVGCGGKSESDKKVLKLSHNLAEDHPLHKSFLKFKEEVEKSSNGKLGIQIYPNGILGNEKAVIEQVQTGVIDMAKGGTNIFENFNPIYEVLSLPYIFDSIEHMYKVMDSEIAEEFYKATEKDGFIGLSYYDAGARSFYTKNRKIMRPEDLKGLKIRVMESQTSIKMMQLFGASATPLPYGDIYTALQQGVIDGAENNTTALTIGKHGEVAKVYSFDQHMFLPDVLVISTKTWEKLSSEERNVLKQSAKIATEYHKEIWGQAVEQSVEEAKKMGVEFCYPDVKLFQNAVTPLIDEARKNPEYNEIIDRINSKK